ncbi:MAG: Zn-dependent hydrolase [Rhodospirillaceae bacterium]|jgi:N-carbamoyl-L-amino-acid hydrolase|nr:Zn-dependent hydrolase [Rhodospirillaceae bacterium]MBT4688732.1 Zn-dependent hydrolase [Rhodospirillaceae bacterium]MBT5083442.1 Zn-dependent hydrolase [Rhodospirillaceae bacterium]MBT5525508.1 Zn-dependent hydrolase [Rhodospirillaceae bacterium]MBT5880640.1 Zn-dependent hydrolase [Rhodospirillaceae bacterium]
MITDLHADKNILEIDGARLWDSLEASGEIGKLRDTGLRRLPLSDADKEMRDLFCTWARDAGCTVTVDQVGNIFARRPGTEDSLPAIATGSHLDTQMCGGKYDGVLGVMSGLEVIRTLNDRGIQTKRAMEVVVWTNEEGARYTPPMQGSLAFIGDLSLDEVLRSEDADGLAFGEELQRIGYDGARALGESKFAQYYELHIEQGPALEAMGIDIGIVVSGFKSHGVKIEVTGRTAHVGPTPMDQRQNALVGAAHLVTAVDGIGWQHHPQGGKATTSQISCFPNLPGIISESANLTVDFRHPEPEVADQMLSEVKAAMLEAADKANVSMAIVDSWSFGDNPFAGECIQHLSDTADAMDVSYMEIRSQAGHDAYAIGKIAPMGMIFTPCTGGISHNVEESIELDRTVPGVNLLLNAMVTAANR